MNWKQKTLTVILLVLFAFVSVQGLGSVHYGDTVILWIALAVIYTGLMFVFKSKSA